MDKETQEQQRIHKHEVRFTACETQSRQNDTLPSASIFLSFSAPLSEEQGSGFHTGN